MPATSALAASCSSASSLPLLRGAFVICDWKRSQQQRQQQQQQERQ
jgi:hypothetical protein